MAYGLVFREQLNARLQAEAEIKTQAILHEQMKEQTVKLERDIIERKQNEELLKGSREQLRKLTGYLQFVLEDERTRIGREIHDELGQALVALKLDVSWLKNRLAKDQGPLIEKIESIHNSWMQLCRVCVRFQQD